MKKFNSRGCHGHHGSKRRELPQHAVARIHSHTYINTVTTIVCEAPTQLLQKLESNFSFECAGGRASKSEYPEKTACFSFHFFGA